MNEQPTVKLVRDNYKRYCKDKEDINEIPLSYRSWLELEVLAHIDNFKAYKEGTHTCKHENIDWDNEPDFVEMSGLDGMSSPFVTAYYICPDCDAEVEGWTEGGV